MWRQGRCSPLLHKAQAGITERAGYRAVWILCCFHSGAKRVPSLGSQMKMLLCSPRNFLTQLGVKTWVIWASCDGAQILGDLLGKWFNSKTRRGLCPQPRGKELPTPEQGSRLGPQCLWKGKSHWGAAGCLYEGQPQGEWGHPLCGSGL